MRERRSKLLSFVVVATVVAAVAAVWDFRTGRIPNWLTLGGVVVGIVAHFVQGWRQGGFYTALAGAGLSLGGVVFCSIAPGLMYWKGGMGGGDLKLFAALGALCLPMLGIEAQVYSLVVAAVVAPARLVYEGRFFRVLGGALALLLNPFRRPEKRRALPQEAMTWFRLGPAVFIGMVATLLVNGYALVAPAAVP